MCTQEPPARRRSAADLHEACRAAVIAETTEQGLGRLSIEGVARRAKVAKTSLYRHWSSVEDLLLDALAEAMPVEQVSFKGDALRADLLRALEQLVGWLEGPNAPAVAAILAERRRRPDLVEALYTRVFDTHGNRFTSTVIHHYAARGAIDPRLVTPVVVDIGEALVLKHQLDTGRTPDADALIAIVDQAILPALGHPPPLQEGTPA
ncbi:TetR/AcrR family transcriptional regulator [Saccharopolyspora flava]|uniref:Transcriptional regulator, TetR family n=1 Tax=Saccharopolyspora flava TaxID=95161 RepID=A0A1I6TMR0_9PSEU|nr:TetR/AcrR family transcriptional regulator [Saccharopolyspora flava]SFS90486.1 transcriptional regulator, TetR family [Saccharopolyspora flava]